VAGERFGSQTVTCPTCGTSGAVVTLLWPENAAVAAAPVVESYRCRNGCTPDQADVLSQIAH
jgi:hypothetical protein